MSLFDLNKVLWRDGDVITQDHLFAVDKWTENLVGLLHRFHGAYGFFRDPVFQDSYNTKDSLVFQQIEGIYWRATVNRLQAINAFGIVLRIDEPRTIDFRFQRSKTDAEGSVVVYLVPKGEPKPLTSQRPDDISSGVVMYTEEFDIRLNNEGDHGIPLWRFIIQGDQIAPDTDYIPFSTTVNGSEWSEIQFRELLVKITKWGSMVSGYVDSLLATPEMQAVWLLATNFVRYFEYHSPILFNVHQTTSEFFSRFQQFLNLVKAEVRILNQAYSHESLRQHTLEVTSVLDKPLLPNYERFFDASTVYNDAEHALNVITKYLAYLPAGPVVEKTIPLKKVELVREQAVNKLAITFDGDAQFVRNKSRISIYLRNFTKGELAGGNVRVGLGSAVYGMLIDLKDVLRKMPGDPTSLVIDCPPEIINRETASGMTVYIPPPLGENANDLRRQIQIVMRD